MKLHNTQYGWRGLFTLCVLSVASALCPGHAAAADDTAAAQKVFDDLYAPKLAAVSRTPSHDDDIALAKQLADAAMLKDAPPALVKILCEQAFALASRHPDGYRWAFYAISVLANRVPDTMEDCIEAALFIRGRQYAQAESAEHRNLFAEKQLFLLRSLATHKLKKGDVKGREAALRRAIALAIKLKSPEVDSLRRELEGSADEKRATQLAARLQGKTPSKATNAVAQTLTLLLVLELNRPLQAATVAGPHLDVEDRGPLVLAAKPIDTLTTDEAGRAGLWYGDLIRAFADRCSNATLHRAAGVLRHFLDQASADDVRRGRAKLQLISIEKLLKDRGESLANTGARPTPARPTTSTPVDKPGLAPTKPTGTEPGKTTGVVDGSALAEELVVHYSFDEPSFSGDTITNLARPEFAGVLRPPTRVQGVVGDAIKLNGKSWVTMGHKGIAGNLPRCVMMWIKTTQHSGHLMSWGMVYKKANGVGWFIQLSSTGMLRYRGDPRNMVAGSTKVNDGKWHHVAVVLVKGDPSLTGIRLYVDGKLEAVSRRDKAPVGTKIYNRMRIGSYFGRGGNFEGEIDEARIFRREVTAQEIATIYAAERQGMPVVITKRQAEHLPASFRGNNATPVTPPKPTPPDSQPVDPPTGQPVDPPDDKPSDPAGSGDNTDPSKPRSIFDF